MPVAADAVALFDYHIQSTTMAELWLTTALEFGTVVIFNNHGCLEGLKNDNLPLS
jgi:hypothetical protein